MQLVGIDSEKFDYFFDKYYDKIFSYAFWQCGDHDAASDVSGEVFLLAWDRRRQFRWQGYSFGAWLFQIARSVLSHKRRRDKVRREIEFVPGRHDPVDENTPDVLLERDNERELVRFCLDQLPDDPHEVLVLHYFVGMTTRQIALVTKRPLGTVFSLLSRGQKAVQRYLEEYLDKGVLSAETHRAIRRSALEDSKWTVLDGLDDE